MSTLSEDRVIANLCRASFKDFVREFWPEVPGAGTLIWNWHLDVLADELQEVAERLFEGKPKLHDTVVNISPGTSKSSLASILFHPWTWTRMPQARHLSASHTELLVLDLASKARSVIRSEKYQQYFPEIKIREDQDTKGYYANTHGGDRITCTVAGKSPMGLHAHFQVIDDPIDPKKATSEAEIKIASDFMTTVLPTRKTDKERSVMFLIMQRLRQTDPSGLILERSRIEGASPVRHICLPAELPRDEAGNWLPGNVSPPELVKNYKDGLMDPLRLSRNVLRQFEITLTAYEYSGQFLQSPVTPGGGMFREPYFNQRIKAAPYNCKRIRYWDRAATMDGGCYTAGVLMARDSDGNFYVEHVEKGQWEPTERNNRMRAVALRDRSKYGKNEPVIYFEMEGGSSGRDAAKGVVKALAGFHVREHRVTGKKEVRAEPWSAQLAAKNVHMVEDKTWSIPDYISEHLQFPLGRFKDQVDASTGAFNCLVQMKPAGTLHTYSIGKRKKSRIVVSSRAGLAESVIEQKAVVVWFDDHYPMNTPDPVLGNVVHNLGTFPFKFSDIDPADHQETWDIVVSPYDLLPEELILQRDHAKKLWSFLLKKRDPYPVTFICMSDNDRRAESTALAVADAMHMPRKDSIFYVDFPERKADDKAAAAPNRYVYDTVRAARGMVV